MRSDEGVPKHPQSFVAITCQSCDELEQLNLELRKSMAELLYEKSEKLQMEIKLKNELSEKNSIIEDLKLRVKMLEQINEIKENHD